MEIELWRCKYKGTCSAHGCMARADTLMLHLDEQGGVISRVALCDEHVKKAIVGWGGLKVHDRRPRLFE